jgi:molybdopterin/thiamine biosynthesis adenylyltransferase
MDSADDVNMLALMTLAGVPEEVALEKLKTTVLITAAENPTCAKLAANLGQLLERTFEVVTSSPADVHVSIGTDEPASAVLHLRVKITDSSEVVLLPPDSQEMCAHDSASAPGLLLKVAACYIAGQVTARAIAPRHAYVDSSFVVAANQLGMTLAELNTRVDLDRAVLIGGGGVANGFLWALEEVDAYGTMDVVDPKKVSSSNLNRCLYFHEGDVGQPKAEVLAKKFNHAHLSLAPSVGTFADLSKKRSVRRAITTTDSRAARRGVRNQLPLEIIDASTTGVSEVVTFSEKQPTDSACLACIYIHIPQEEEREQHIADALGLELAEVKRQFIDAELAEKLARIHTSLNADGIKGMAMDSLFRQLCGTGDLLDAKVEQVLAPLAFVSNLAGALLAIELIRAELGGLQRYGENYLCLNPWTPPFKRARRHKGKQSECEFCSDKHTDEVMKALWPNEFAAG